MNKKQEALRRGLRSFIEDTSKELADLEGRPLRSPENPTDTAQVDPSAVAVGAEPERASPAGAAGDGERVAEKVQRARPEAQASPGPAPPPPAAPPTPDAPVHASDPGRTADAAARTADGTARVADGVARATAAAGAVSIPQPPKASPAPVSPAPESRPSVSEPPEAARHAAPTPAVTREESPPAQAERPKRRAQAPVRRRSRPAAEIGADGVSPAQVHARKGVCFAYSLNHECWRVAGAYCNSALQVCITRECPVYHLHKDALERRFAKKFKHFW